MKHIKYLKYVLRHKWYVFLECYKLGIPITGIFHDISKFLPSEWFSYTETFYGKKIRNCYDCIFCWGSQCSFNGAGIGGGEQAPRCKDFATPDYELAWLKHQHRNPHHWQYWMLTQDDDVPLNLEMPLRYRKEMLADWRGAGRAITGSDDTVTWYEQHKSKMMLAPETKKWIDERMKV